MSFSNVYELNDYEIVHIYESMAENFKDDELYRTVFPNDATRGRMVKFFFKHYLKAIAPFCHFIADSKEKNCVMVVYDSKKEIAWNYHLRLFFLNIKMLGGLCSLHSAESVMHVIKCWDMFTSRWVKEFVVGESYHIDMLYTVPSKRKQGLAKQLLQVVCEDAKKKGIDVTIETHHAQNQALYEEVGFRLMSVITQTNYELKQYCMLMRNSEV